jgi:2,5-dihydroxypyridine 5,6-dioxygenase
MTTNTDRAIENVRLAFARNATRMDRVVIATDAGTPADVRDAIVEAARRFGFVGDPLLLAPPPVSSPNAEPDAETAAALGDADYIVLAPSMAISHTAAVNNAVSAGARLLVMDGATVEMLAVGGGAADYEQMHERGLMLERLWNEGEHVRLTSVEGTDFEATIRDRESWRWDGYTFEADWHHLRGCAMPDGEVGIAPIEGSANGTVVWDGSVQSLGLLREPVVLTVKDSRVINIAGGEQAAEFARALTRLEDPASYYCPAEIAIGINDAARISGTMREDKKALGTVHIATGTNSDIGGTVSARTHIDGLLRKPSLWIDGRQVLDAGRLMISDYRGG